MDLKDVEEALARGVRLGFRKETDDPEYLGWVLVSKLKANDRILELFPEEEGRPKVVSEEQRRRARPYLVRRIELKRSVHESGEYESEADYRLHEKYWHGSLLAVQQQLTSWGLWLEEAKDSRELDAP
jgi:hypothetical protein